MEDRVADITTIAALGMFVFFMVMTFVFVFHCENYYKTKLTYDGNKDKQRYLK